MLPQYACNPSQLGESGIPLHIGVVVLNVVVDMVVEVEVIVDVVVEVAVVAVVVLTVDVSVVSVVDVVARQLRCRR
jgi:hypothetical protein